MNILEWIDVGKVSAERDDNLVNYFYDNGVLRSVLESKSSFLVLGRKGAGKTAVFRYLRENPSEHLGDDDVLVSLSFEDYNWRVHSLLANAEAAESLAYKQSWRFVILVEVIKAYSSRCTEKGVAIPKPIDKAQRLLERIFEHPLPTIYQLIGRKLLGLSKVKLPKAGLDLEEGDFDSVEVSGGEVSFDDVAADDDIRTALSQNISNIIAILESAISQSKPLQFRTIICFDRVDEAWDDVSLDVSRKVLAGLVSACDSLTEKYDGVVRPIVFLREDIFSVLPLNDSNKLREDCGALLKWERDDLIKLLLRRLSFFAEQKGVDAVDDFEALFDKKEMRQRSKPPNYLLKRTMMRPRDMICFLRRTVDAMRDSANDPFEETPDEYTHLSVEAIYTAEPGYSDWLRQELLDEWSVQRPRIKELFSAIQNHGSTQFKRDELESQLKSLGVEFTQTEIVDDLRFLFANSVIGFKVGASTAWRYRCFSRSQGFIESDVYKLHDGLIRALNVKEPRDT
ncbi:P-loop ATPase, Sll1717 family [Crateriforma spongiae]|uniref:P-loop ATPase, Sll1717 family n=1 Tax=Crateriforma spongiae TaxID=2724528 RepID=UPI0014461BDD|nr:ATPase [Crateriforma spongiae]